MGGGFALLTGTGTILAGFGGLGGLPLIAAGTLGVLGEKFFLKILKLFSCYLLQGLSSLMCIGPIYCRTPAGQCCSLLVDGDRGIPICPLSC